MASPLAPKLSHGDWVTSYKPCQAPVALLPLPLPPHRADKLLAAPVAKPRPPKTSLVALKAYHCAMGLCFKYDIKWSKDHQCAPEILLAVEAVWSTLPEDDSEEPQSPTIPKELVAQILLAMSKAVVSGVATPRTMQFQGRIQQLPMTILLDSGSSSSFISHLVVQQLTGEHMIDNPCQVQVAGGGILQSIAMIQQLPWYIDSCEFHSDF